MNEENLSCMLGLENYVKQKRIIELPVLETCLQEYCRKTKTPYDKIFKRIEESDKWAKVVWQVIKHKNIDYKSFVTGVTSVTGTKITL